MIGLLIAAAVSGATGYFSTGNSLYEGVCAPTGDRLACGSYVSGAFDALVAIQVREKLPPTMCLSTEVTVGQVSDVFRQYLRDNPADRDMRGAIVVAKALAAAFPCPK